MRKRCAVHNDCRPLILKAFPATCGSMNKPLSSADSIPQTPLAAEVERRRTFAIISHPDAGKTTLTEKLLLFGGAINLAGQVKAKRDRRSTRSDWMAIERERGISVVTSVMTFDYDGRVFNLLDTPGHEDFSEDTYRTLTAVDSRGHGDRRRQGHRGAHAQAVRSLPAARHPDRHLHQQDGSREPRSVRTPGRDREDAGARHHADDLADRARARLRRHLRHRDRRDAADLRRRQDGRPPAARSCRTRRQESDAGCRRDRRRTDAGQRPLPAVRFPVVPRGASDAGVLRLGLEEFRRQGSARRARELRAAAAPAGRRQAKDRSARKRDDRLRVQDPGQHGSRTTATASPSRGCARASSGAA